MREAMQRVGRRVAAGLRELAGGEQAVRFITHLHRGVDEVAARAAAGGLVPDCHAGCAHCCRVRVEATDPEVLHIARGLRQLPAPRQAALRAALRAHVAGQGAARPGHVQYCSFLVDQQCSIYALRPAACRKAHSLAVEQCAAHAAQIPQDLKLLTEAEALMAGTAAGYEQAQLPATAHELNAAVLAALSDDKAETRWYGGERVF